MDFIQIKGAENQQIEAAIFAGGCFWGVEHLFKKIDGVLSVESGYTGGYKDNPTYEEVCFHKTGHTEAVRLTFDPKVVSYRKLTKLFFEIHDPTQLDRQGPDVGEQYRSEIFYFDQSQQEISIELIDILKSKGFEVHTKVTPASKFWPAEVYHQDYYAKTGGTPYCHVYIKRF
ncbi:MAG: peptide-methionine (S)-S-oxide reductase MsrA [Bacteroidales bacterium]|nr:peptide-methionine (S)-S-oxide reductase MsrA [Bacteroidales bacterium]